MAVFFPTSKVADVIDGRELAPPNERFDMPFWGLSFSNQVRIRYR
jgi:hypothetical protein